MTPKWYSVDNLRKAWQYASIDLRDDFTFDIIDYQDVRHNIDLVLRTLHTQIQQGQYYPIPLLSIPVPKSHHSFRPGTTIHPVDLIVLYALAQQLAPPLDKALSDSAYAYRLNPRRDEKKQPLFTDRESPEEGSLKMGNGEAVVEMEEGATGFPYDWFGNWIRFHRATTAASDKFEYVAVTDITAYFENVSLRVLIDRIREMLGETYRDVINSLYDLLKYWDWVVSAEKAGGRGLPQGNDVSSFLSNIYLLDLDEAMLSVVKGRTDKYFRYVDDIKLYTSSKSEARQALVELERTLRTLGLNTQTAKTEIKQASEAVDSDVDEWMKSLENDAEDKVEAARTFVVRVFDASDPQSVSKWQRVYLRSLTVLGQANDDIAVSIALDMFLADPSLRRLQKNFKYLRRFVYLHRFEDDILSRLLQDGFTFNYHRAYMYRLAAYSRGESTQLVQLALEHTEDTSTHCFSRVGALLFLSTNKLSPSQLAQISQLVASEGNDQVLRASYIALCQHGGNELRVVLDMVSYFSAPHQDYLRRYLFSMLRNDDWGNRVLTAFDRARLSDPFFIRYFHQLDLIKANRSLRPRFREVMEKKLSELDNNGPRLGSRLQGIYDTFVDNP